MLLFKWSSWTAHIMSFSWMIAQSERRFYRHLMICIAQYYEQHYSSNFTLFAIFNNNRIIVTSFRQHEELTPWLHHCSPNPKPGPYAPHIWPRPLSLSVPDQFWPPQPHLLLTGYLIVDISKLFTLPHDIAKLPKPVPFSCSL